MDKKLMYYTVIICVVLIIGNTCSEAVLNRRIRNAANELKAITDRVQQLDIELRIKDSIMLESISLSYERINELSKLKNMNQKQIDSLEYKLSEEKKLFDNKKDDLLSW